VTRALKTCATCGRPCHGSRCPTHAQAHATTEAARRHRKTKNYGYRRAHWQRIRKLRLIFAGGLCELRLPGCTVYATHVHLDPAFGGNHDAATLADTRACCSSCSGAVDAPRAHMAGGTSLTGSPGRVGTLASLRRKKLATGTWRTVSRLPDG
jgi:hypothetical protein